MLPRRRFLDVRDVAIVPVQQCARGGLLAALDGALRHDNYVDPSDALHEARELVAVLAGFGQDAGRVPRDDLNRPVCRFSFASRALDWRLLVITVFCEVYGGCRALLLVVAVDSCLIYYLCHRYCKSSIYATRQRLVKLEMC